MTQSLKYASDEPLAHVIEFLEKANQDALATKVIDVFAEYSYQIEQFNLIAKLYLDVRDIEKAERYALKVLEMSSQPHEKYNARANLAKMYNNINEPEKSLQYSRINAKVDSENPDTKLETVFSLYLLGEKAEAEKILRKMKENEHTLDERHSDIVNFNLGTYDMEHGKFLEGLAGFLLNVKKLELWFSPKELPYRFWNGGIFPGKTLIMFMEGGGIGDEFITIRWMHRLKELGFKPLYYTTRPDLFKIFKRCGYDVIMDLEGLPSDSLWTYAMQVPLWLKVAPEEVVMSNYLEPSTEAREKWSHLKQRSKIKVGVRWQGNSKNERDLHRQVPLDGIMSTLHEVFSEHKDRVEYFSLQIGDGSELACNFPDLIDLTSDIESYDDTLAFCENLDYVVTSCTSVLHGSAIVGTKTLALIPISAYFTWVSPPTPGRPEDSSIWYPDNLRLFRQKKTKNWDEPLSLLKDYLLNDLRGRL